MTHAAEEGSAGPEAEATISLILRALEEVDWPAYFSGIRSAYRIVGDRVWLLIAASLDEIDFDELLARLPQQHHADACTWLAPLVRELPIFSLSEAQSFLDFAGGLEPSFRAAVGQYLTPHMAANPDLGIAVGREILGSASTPQGKISCWAHCFAAGCPRVAAAYAAAMPLDDPSQIDQVAWLLTALPQKHEALSLFVAAESLFAAAVIGRIEVLGFAAWYALCRIAPFSVLAQRGLLEAIERRNGEAIGCVLQTLFHQELDELTVTGERVPLFVDRIIHLAIDGSDQRQTIDSLLSSTLYAGPLGSAVAQSLVNLGGTPDICSSLTQTFRALGEKEALFAVVLSAWLLQAETDFGSLRALLSMCTHGQASTVLDEHAFTAASDDQQLKACRRLLAMTHHGPTLCRFIDALVGMTTLGEARLSIGSQMLNAAFEEFPGATEEFLKSKVETPGKDTQPTSMFRHIYANALRWRRVLKKLPTLKELRPSESELLALRAQKRRFQRDVARIASEKSVLMSLVTGVHLAQGRKFATRMPDGRTTISEMMQASHSVELPSSERADPMRGLLARANLLRGAR